MITQGTRERRVLAHGVAVLEARAEGDAPAVRTIGGLAALFGVETTIGGYFREVIARGAFTAAIAEDDVRCLFNHDPNFVLGRNTVGTLTLRESDEGLAYECVPPATTWASDLLVTVGRGDVSQSSFAFEVVEDKWLRAEEPGGLPLRTILRARLYDVSPVTYPAYEETTVAARSAAAAAGAAEARAVATQIAIDGLRFDLAVAEALQGGRR